MISAETANNAATGAAMIPLLALGLPGGALTAMMVAVFQMHDLQPGPLVFMLSPDLIWIVFAAMFYANLSILLVGVLETKTILNLLKIPFQFLAPLILMLATTGAYISRGLVLDVMIMFAAGIIGYFLRRTGFSIPAIVLGLILGKIGEQNFAQRDADGSLRHRHVFLTSDLHRLDYRGRDYLPFYHLQGFQQFQDR